MRSVIFTLTCLLILAGISIHSVKEPPAQQEPLDGAVEVKFGDFFKAMQVLTSCASILFDDFGEK